MGVETCFVGTGTDGIWKLCVDPCFDTVGLVIWPAKIVPEMTYYVSSGTSNPTHSLRGSVGIGVIFVTVQATNPDRHTHIHTDSI